LAAKNVQLMTKGEVLQFHHRPATESAGQNGDDETHILKHPENTIAVNPKTLDFSPLSEFLAGTTGISDHRTRPEDFPCSSRPNPGGAIRDLD
jgi:hypothetical protein